MRELRNRQLAFVFELANPSSSAPMLGRWFDSNVSERPAADHYPCPEAGNQPPNSYLMLAAIFRMSGNEPTRASSVFASSTTVT